MGLEGNLKEWFMVALRPSTRFSLAVTVLQQVFTSSA
jgi:hypothetical protein